MDTVSGSLKEYDLPDLFACIAPRKVLMINIKDQINEPAEPDLIEKEMKIVRSVYSLKNAQYNLNILSLPADKKIDKILYDWLK